MQFSEQRLTYTGRYRLYLLCLVGLLLRLYVLVGGRTLWLDEAHLATTFLHRDWAELFLPLGNDQVAPVGFLILAKCFVGLTNSLELGLRLPSFIGGAGSLICAVILMRLKRLEDPTAVIFVSMLCLLKPFVYYSYEFKQYSIELFCYLLMLCSFEYFRRAPDIRSLFFIWLSGLFSVFCAMTAPFILFFQGAYILWYFVSRKSYFPSILAFWMALSWATGYSILLFHTTSAEAPGDMGTFWLNAMLPNSGILTKLRWTLNSFIDIFDAAGLAKVSALGAVLAILGFSVSWRRDSTGVFILLALLGLAFAAALLCKYPFSGRLLLFALPGPLLLVAEGLSAFLNVKLIPKLAKMGCVILIVLCGLVPTIDGLKTQPPFSQDSLREAIHAIDQSFSRGQAVYISSYALPIFRIYRYQLKTSDNQIVLGHDPRAAFGDDFNIDKLGNFSWFMNDLQNLAQKREVWFLLTRLNDPAGIMTRTMVVYFCGLQGELIERHEYGDSAAYLCRFYETANLFISPKQRPAFAPIHKSYILEGGSR